MQRRPFIKFLFLYGHFSKWLQTTGRSSSCAGPKDHVHLSGSPLNRRGASIQFLRFAPHDPNENRAFAELQGFGLHGTNESSFRQCWNRGKSFHRKLVDSSEVRREKNCQEPGCTGRPESSDRTGESQALLNVVLIY